MGVTLIGFEDGMVHGDRLGVAEAWDDDALFGDTGVAGSLLGGPGRGAGGCVIVGIVAVIGGARAWAGAGRETDGVGVVVGRGMGMDMGMGGLCAVATIGLEPHGGPVGGTGANAAVWAWVWGRDSVSALCDGGTSRLVSWDPICMEEEVCVVLDAEGILDPWLEGFTARLSDARDASSLVVTG
jgi:hypothetical protein